MPVRIVTADERLAGANNKTSVAIFGPAGCGKTSLLRTLPPDQTVSVDRLTTLKVLRVLREGNRAAQEQTTASSCRSGSATQPSQVPNWPRNSLEIAPGMCSRANRTIGRASTSWAPSSRCRRAAATSSSGRTGQPVP